MRSLIKVVLLSTFLWLLNFNLSYAQNLSNKGTDFWLAYGNHVRGYTPVIGQEMIVYITSDVNTSGILSVGGTNIPFTVTANAITNVNVPQAAYLGNSEGKITNKGIHITSLKPVVVYSHIYDTSVSGATLVLPTNTLGKEYYSINYQQVSNDDNSFSFFFVVAIEDNTQITIKPSVNTLGGLQAGVTSAPISLNKGEVYQVFGTKTSSSNPFRGTDLTGSVIKSISTSNEICKKIAVFSGSGKISIGCLANNAPNGQAGSADNLFQQVYPTATWGNSFVTVPSKNRNYDIYRVFKSDPSAVVKVNGAIIQSTDFTNGLYYDFPSQVVNYVESDKPIQVIQYAVTQGKSINCAPIAGDVGDPEMIFLNPLSQTLSKITMYSTPLFQILRHYINVVIPTSGVSSFKVDGVSKSALFLPVASAPGFSYAQLDMNAGTHNLQADIGFNAIAYGFGSAESYGYAAGASLESAGLQARSASTKQVKTVGCINEGYNFDVTLPYEPTKLTLDLDNGDPAVQVPIKLTKTEVINGVTNYTYEVINDVKFTTARRYSIKLIVEKSTTDGCGSADEVNLDLDMQNVPQSSFTSDIQQSCISSPITFTDGTVSNGTTIVKWYWDFGDGIKEIKTTGEPVQHSYAAAGDYKVSLVTETDGGCQSSPITPLAIHINRTPDALFSVPALKCETQAFQFTDKSVANEGSITKWNWDFGDGNTSTEQNPVHSFSKAGTYVVKLIVQTDKGCLSNESTQNVVVNAIPEVAFEVPDFCLADGAAQFTNKTTIADGTGSQLTYLWDFGDSQANAQRPNTSTLKDASHRYTKAGRYTVRLTVKSANGCEVTITKMFVVNGSVPKADFNIKNPGACSNGLVEFEDKVVVDLDEEVTKIEWIYDFANNPTVKEIDDEPAIRAAPTRVYSHKYPTFTSPASMTYQVRILAYTGGTCVSIITKSVTVLAVPLAEFDLPPACLTNGTAEFKNKSSIAGTGLTLSYAWDFGDTLSTPQNPNISSETDPAHKYSKAGDYIVKLVVTSSSGCSTTIIKTLTVAGSVPDAAFTVLTPDKLCSDAPVIFEDHTKIAFGEVTKIEWYYDYGNNPSLKFTDDNPAKRTDSPRQYTHSYPMFFSPATKTVIVRMLAFSGATCVDEELVSVTLHAVPRVQFDPIPDICSDSQPITLTQAKEIHGVLSGKGTYTGKGITATGQFSQAIAGLGTHTITYTFVADNGCVDSKTQTITVNPIPTASLGPPLFVLDGADIKLPAVVTGNIISYKWSPALYLDNDDILVPVAKPTDDITYTLTVTTDKGCIATASVFVKVLKMPEVPNSFTPNGDGVNDTWNVKHLEFYPGATVDIFNRYGDRLFKIENYLKPWDGTFNSSELPVGTYYYIINPKNGRKVVSGSVSIIR